MKSIRIGDRLQKALTAGAQAEGITESEFIRRAIAERVDEALRAKVKPAAEGTRFSGRLAGLDHLIGAVDIPGPVSTRRIGDQYARHLGERWEARQSKRRRSATNVGSR